jgi:hypothetical protein
MKDIAKVSVVGAILLIAAFPCTSYGGHFVVAFQRQLSAWENNAGTGCGGGLVCRVWVWNEDGNPMPNIDLYTTWDVLMGATNSDGRCEIAIYEDDYDLKCVDGQGSTSESVLMMTTRRPECWGHYSFEVGFLYKTDASNPGEFDLDLNGTWNDRNTPQDDDAPYTKSLAYSGVDCTDYWSDQSELGNWQTPPSYFGQTFVANGDRVVAARVQGALPHNQKITWKLQIVTYPGLQSVGPSIEVPYHWPSDPDPNRFPFGWEGFWGVNDCPVVPGQTYMLQAWRDGDGMNIWRVNQDVYPHGQYYEGTTPFPGLDLNGHICCMNYAGLPDYDFKKDGRMDFKDICILANYWSGDESSVDVAPPPAGDGAINYKDLAVLIANWLTASTIPPLPAPASNPNPGHGAMNIDKNADLSWTAGEGATSHDVYFGSSSPPPFTGNQATATFDPGTMAYSTIYYWKIDSVNGWGKTAGEEWTFSTSMPPPP